MTIDILEESEKKLIDDINMLSENITELETKNTDLKGKQNSIKDSNSSSIKLYYDTNDTFHKYKLSNILIGIFFIIGTVCFYMLQYKYEQFIHFIDNVKIFNAGKVVLNNNINSIKNIKVKSVGESVDTLVKNKDQIIHDVTEIIKKNNIKQN
jgi:hypothetical protein|tara:strand:- start:657 stop:1115 length:459 start_codon:yes stop_codon:yes gene_type:complete